LSDYEVVAWISALVLFITGIMYLVFHCGYGKKLQEQFNKENKKFEALKEEKANPILRENLM